MYGNGVLIGMGIIVAVHRQILKDLTGALTVSCAVAVGSAVRGAVCPLATTSFRPAGATMADFASRLPVSL